MNKALVVNIQKFSIHDGDGIRTTIFFKGCALHCLWCHNPESQQFKPELLIYKERCRTCGACQGVCPYGAISITDDNHLLVDKAKCRACGACVDVCAYGALEIAGNYYTVDALVEEAKKDMILFEESGGGITLSGGEVMLQPREFLLDLVKRLKRLGLNIAVDTSGHAPWPTFEKISPYIDTFLYDIKTLDEQKHADYIGGDLDLILRNLKRLNDLAARLNIRIPLIGKVNDHLTEMKKIASWLRENKIKVAQINILPYHATGSSKYERLGIQYEPHRVGVPDAKLIEKTKNLFIEMGFNNTHIGG